MRWTVPVLVLLASCGGEGPELRGTYSGTGFVTVGGSYGPTGAGVARISCAGGLSVESQTGDKIRGSFERRDCAGLPRAGAVRGTFYGTVLADGTASVTFSAPPLDTSDVFTSAGGCSSSASAMGPYLGRMSASSVTLSTAAFVVSCCCATRPAPGGGVTVGPSPWYSAEYRIEGVR